GASAVTALCLGLVYGVATIAWPYAHAFWSEPLAALFLVLASLFAVRGSRRNRARDWFVASLMLGVASVTRSAMLACVPAFALYLLVGAAQRGAGSVRARLARQLTGFAAGFLVPGVSLAGYDVLRFGSALDTGNGFVNGLAAIRTIFGGNVFVGLYGLL